MFMGEGEEERGREKKEVGKGRVLSQVRAEGGAEASKASF